MAPTCRLERVVAGGDRRGAVDGNLLAGFVLLHALIYAVAAGVLYARYGAGAFFATAALCGIALPLTPGLRSAGKP